MKFKHTAVQVGENVFRLSSPISFQPSDKYAPPGESYFCAAREGAMFASRHDGTLTGLPVLPDLGTSLEEAFSRLGYELVSSYA